MASMVCPNCGTESEGEERCPGCSLPLVVSCPECGADNPADEETCDAAHGTADGGP
jgi:hypothetical protein